MPDTRTGPVILDGSSLPAKADIGGKAWSIARMLRLGLPVPPAFVLPTQACRDYLAGERRLRDAQWDEALRGVAHLEEQTRRRFGGTDRPLLVSVRSGAAVSMPGMMDTVLNLGVNARVARAIGEETGDPGYARDTWARFVRAYALVVLKVDLPEASTDPTELLAEAARASRTEVPTDPYGQLRGAICAVFDSWMSSRARAYRRHWGIDNDGGTAVTVQAMVFGNADHNSGTGVLFSRNPLTGESQPYGEYLPRAQGEDVVSGSRTPLPLEHLAREHADLHASLLSAATVLEREATDAQDIEFTVERGRLFLLQSRVAKRSAEAAVRIAVALVREGLISADEAVRRVPAARVRQLLRPVLPDAVAATATILAHGVPACHGVAQGLAVATPAEAERLAEAGQETVLVRRTTSPEDVQGMISARAVCTERGGSTSHAAVVSRALGRPCIVDCGEGVVELLTGREITVDATSGTVLAGLLPLSTPVVDNDDDLREFARWVAERCPVRVIGTEDAAEDSCDLDALGVVEPEDVRAAVVGAAVVRGALLDTDAGLTAVLDTGVRTLAVDQPLPVQLACCHLLPNEWR